MRAQTLSSPPAPLLEERGGADSTVIHRLDEVEVRTSRPSTFRSVAPVQTLESKDWIKMNALQVSDAAKYFSGIHIKDYGGTGGLKTISIRSLGANYSGISYDGIIVHDYQTGQSDLSRFSLENLQSLTLSIGENDQIFQTARHRASVGTLAITTAAFFPDKEKNEIKANLKGGSFGLLNSSVLLKKPLDKQFFLSIFGEYLKSDGNYPYKQNTSLHPDSVSIRHRNNSDVTFYILESNLSRRFKNDGKIFFKSNYNKSNRGYPGPATFHNTYSGERSKDQTFFSQLNYIQKLNRLFDFQANAKFSLTSNDYTDKNNKYPGGLLETFYNQREYYLNMTWLYTMNEKLSFSWANDGIYGNFKNSFKNCPFPSRITWLSALSGKYEIQRFTITGSLLNNITEDKLRTGNATKNSMHLSPYLGFSVKPSETLPVRLRGYYKNTYRFPTFGDMYLSPVQNDNLQPENANQYNLGATFSASINDWFPLLGFSGDVYHNRINNKIVALPRSSMFIWSVQNYGKVEIKGLDLNMNMQLQWNHKFSCRLSGVYTYQNVLDKTDKDSQMYNQQLSYTPRHTASGTIQIETPWVDLNYSLLYCGKRYYERVNRPEFQMKSYTDQGISLQKNIRWKDYQWLLTAECLNFMDESYEVVRSYPMPGRAFRFGVKFNY